MLSRLFGSLKNDNRKLDVPTGSLLTHWRHIFVPAIGAPYSMRAIQTACRLAQNAPGAELKLLYVIEVPRSFALMAALPGDETMAEDTLGYGMEAARSYGIQATAEVVRGREATEALLRHLHDHEGDLLVLGARGDGTRGVPLALCRELYVRAPCEVIVNYLRASD
jgi:nucleotide-binding universal stress UspA family protein